MFMCLFSPGLMWKPSATSSRKFGQELWHHVMPKVLELKGSRTSCDVIISGIFWPNFSRRRSHHVIGCFPGNAKLSTTTAREQNRALGPQIYGRYPNPGKHRKSISTIALAGSAKILGSAVVVDSSVLPASCRIFHAIFHQTLCSCKCLLSWASIYGHLFGGHPWSHLVAISVY